MGLAAMDLVGSPNKKKSGRRLERVERNDAFFFNWSSRSQKNQSHWHCFVRTSTCQVVVARNGLGLLTIGITFFLGGVL